MTAVEHWPGCEARWELEADCSYPDVCGMPIESLADVERRFAVLEGMRSRQGLSYDADCHVIEDLIHEQTLQYFAAHAARPEERDMARVALTTANVKFSRWYE